MSINSIQELHRYAETSLATYADFNFAAFTDENLAAALRQQNTGATFTADQAALFTTRYGIVATQLNTDWTGFSATLFHDRQTGRKVFAVRGTEFDRGLTQISADLVVADILGIGGGYANIQGSDMYRYWKKLTTPGGQRVNYSETEATRLYDVYKGTFLQPAIMTRGAFKAALAMDTGIDSGTPGISVISKDEKVDVTGHSLGGHLALLFARFFPDRVNEIVTLNAPTFITPGDLYLSALGFPSTINSRITRLEADGDGVSEIGNVDPGVAVPIAQENLPGPIAALSTNHSSVNGVDALALMAVLAKLDPTAATDPESVSNMLRASSNLAAPTVENILDTLRRQFLGDVLPTPVSSGAGDLKRTDFYKNLNLLVESANFQAVIGKAKLDRPNAIDLNTLAKAQFSVFLGLQLLSPLTIRLDPTGEALVKQANELLAQRWEADAELTPNQRIAGTENFTEAWLSDRAALLRALAARNTKDNTGGLAYDTSAPSDRTLAFQFYEPGLSEEQTLFFQRNGAGVSKEQRIIFGNDSNNDLTGSDVNLLGDHIYGGAGTDTLTGNAGDDYLEGNEGDDKLNGGDDKDTLLGGAGNDTLDGGQGADTLKGGQGNDSYLLRADNAGSTDTILDSDGTGSVKVLSPTGSETVLTGGKRLAGSEGLWQSDDQRFTYTTRTESDGSTTLRISGAGVKAQVMNFTSGNLGIVLPGEAPPPVTPSTNRTILGDLEPASPQHVDELGNIVTTATAAPERNDTLYDSIGNDLLESFGGMDSIDLTRGGSNWAKAGSGRDFVNGGAGVDLIEAGAGRDVAFGQVGADEIWANTLGTLDELQAQTEAAADGEADLLGGGSGNDKVMGWAGNDALFGGSDLDTIVGGAGADTIFGDRVFGGVSLTDWAVQRQVTTDADGVVTSRKLIFSNFTVDMGLAPDADLIMAGAGDDWVLADGGDDFAEGGDGSDYLVGGTGSDSLFGDAGNDELLGDGDTSSATLLNYADPAAHGDDYLEGGAGADRLTGGGADDELDGGADNDLLLGDSNTLDGQFHGQDQLDGGSGNDDMAGGGRDDILFGGDGGDRMDGDDAQLAGSFHGQDYLEGDAGNDTMVGNGDIDTLYGGAGDDLLWGDSQTLAAQFHGDDFLYGEEGADELVGGGGDDTLSGGDANDKLHGDDQFVAASEHGNDDMDGGSGDDYLRGYGGDDLIKGGSGTDTLIGEAGNDTLEGGTGTDQLSGGAGDDTYVFNSGDSLAAAAEFVDDSEGANRLVLNGMPITGMDLLPTADSSIHLIRSGEDSIYVRGLTTGAMRNVTVQGVAYSAAQFFGMTYARQVDQSSSLDGASLQGGKLGDTLRGSGGNSTMAGGLGNDNLTGSGGGNQYLYGAGDGVDTISNSAPGGASSLPADKLVFGAGINPQEIKLSVAGSSLILKIGGETPGEVRLTGFDPANALRPAGIDRFEFADGTVLTHAQLVARGFDIAGTSADETVAGTSLADRLSGGAGSDLLTGGAGDDTYSFEVGSGNDVVADGDAAAGGNDSLLLGWSVAPWEVTFFRNANDAIVVVGTEQVRLKDYFSGGADAVEHVAFADGTVLSQADITALLQQGTEQDDVIVGDSGNNTLYARGGNDSVSGLAGDDLLAGGTGADLLDGGAGNDTYLFNLGDGADVLQDGGGIDVLRFGAGITAADVAILDSGADLKLRVGGAGDIVTLKNYLAPSPNAALVETIAFADGSSWQLADVLSRRLDGTAGNDVITGFERDDIIAAGAGNDTVHARGGADMIDGGAGDDNLHGQAGNDTYVIYPLGGSDVVAEDLGGLLADADKLRFAGGLVKADMLFARTGSDLLVSSAAKGVAVRIVNQFSPTQDSNGVESMEFSDGTVLDRTAIRQLVSMPTAGDDVLTGDDSSESIDALGGNDVVYGLGGDDVLRGNTGADTLYGGAGNDTYDFRAGDGADVVDDLDPFGGNGGTDTLLLGAGIAPASVTLLRAGDDLQLSTATAGDKVTIAGYYSRGDFERIAFADGTVWNQAAIAAKLPINGTAGADTITGTAAADLIDGGAGQDTIHGGGGDDIVRGGIEPARKADYMEKLFGDAGDDQITGGTMPADMRGGDGNDILEGTGFLDGDLGSNLLIGRKENDKMVVDTRTNNIVIGGEGDELLSQKGSVGTAPAGITLYLYNAGDGIFAQDPYRGSPNATPNDIVSLGQTLYSKLAVDGGIDAAQLWLKVGRGEVDATAFSESVVDASRNWTKYLQIFVAARDYSPTSTDPLRNRKVVVVDYQAFGQEYYATATNNRTFDVEGTLRKHIVWTSDTHAFGGKIAYQYATQGNIDAVTLEERKAILADPNLNLLGQPIAGGQAVAAVAAVAETAPAMDAGPLSAGVPGATATVDPREPVDVARLADWRLPGEVAAVSSPPPMTPMHPVLLAAAGVIDADRRASAPPLPRPIDLWAQVDAWSRLQPALAHAESGSLDIEGDMASTRLHRAILLGPSPAFSRDLSAPPARVEWVTRMEFAQQHV